PRRPAEACWTASAASLRPRPRTASPSVLILENKSPIRPKKTAPAQALRAHADLIAERVRSAPGSPTQLEGPRGVDDPAEGPPERRFEGAPFGGSGIGEGGEGQTAARDDEPPRRRHGA